MTSPRYEDFLRGLVRELVKLPREMEWAEFKRNNANPDEIGQYISALANSAALAGKTAGYIVWGIEDESHEIVGTTFRPEIAKKGNEQLENWLLRLLTPKLDFRFLEVTEEGKRLVLLEIHRATRQPVQFQGQEYIRVGSYTNKLKDHPEKERALWRIFDTVPFEDDVALERVQPEDVLKLLDYPSYFDLLALPLPEGRNEILSALANDDLLAPCKAGGWNIMNLGALLFAKRLDEFPILRRKAVRVVSYKGNSRIETLKERVEQTGYAAAFESLIDYVTGTVPSNEVIRQALRRTVPMYPELALRELVANAVIHQDLRITGAGPMVEIFSDRIEITNPGIPLVDTDRFLDTPPRSRNETLASLMRRLGICEERGSGVDKVVFQTEYYQLPAPLFETAGESTRATLFASRPLKQMDKQDRIRACYMHACLKYVNREYLTNSSVRQRFGIDQRNSATASRLIREAVDDGAIVPQDPGAAPKLMRYVPRWARPQ